MLCCGAKPYNSLRYTCCENKVIKKVDFVHCCGGTTLYDTRSRVCKDGEVRNRTSQFEAYCGGSSLYDKRESICCGGQVHRFVRNQIVEIQFIVLSKLMCTYNCISYCSVKFWNSLDNNLKNCNSVYLF